MRRVLFIVVMTATACATLDMEAGTVPLPLPRWSVEDTLGFYGQCRRAGNPDKPCVCFVKAAQYLSPSPDVRVTGEERAAAAMACGVVDRAVPPQSTGGETI